MEASVAVFSLATVTGNWEAAAAATSATNTPYTFLRTLRLVFLFTALPFLHVQWCFVFLYLKVLFFCIGHRFLGISFTINLSTMKVNIGNIVLWIDMPYVKKVSNRSWHIIRLLFVIFVKPSSHLNKNIISMFNSIVLENHDSHIWTAPLVTGVVLSVVFARENIRSSCLVCKWYYFLSRCCHLPTRWSLSWC